MESLHLVTRDFAAMEKRYRATFFNSLTGFKSGNLVGTQSPDKQLNLAVFSNVVHIGANPPLVGIIQRPASVPRNSYDNIKATGCFTLNHIHPSFFKQAHQTSARYAPEVSEFEATGLTPWFSENHAAPYVLESRIKIGLQFEEEYLIKINDTILLIGRVVETIFDETLLNEDGFIDCEQAKSVTICGLDSYHRTLRLARLTYAKPDQPVRGI